MSNINSDLLELSPEQITTCVIESAELNRDGSYSFRNLEAADWYNLALKAYYKWDNGEEYCRKFEVVAETLQNLEWNRLYEHWSKTNKREK